ncbi:conserved hypothetical protein [Candidatus Brocadia pituitae]|nr:conserved hypothetical protein [Candidatus Brocadia pituitae]
MNKQNTLFMIVIVSFLSLIGMTSFAEEAKDAKAENEQKSKWEFIVVPYLWMTGIDGDVTIKGRDADVDVSFDDILDNLDIAVLSNFIAKKGRWEFFVQPNYIKLSPEGDVDRRALTIDADVETEMLILEFGTFYKLGTWGDRFPVSLNILGGGRYWHFDNEIDLDTDISLSSIDKDIRRKRDVDADKDLIDPFVGLRVGTAITKKVRFDVRGDIGGFDISSETSDLSWQAIGLIEYDLSKRIILGAGYRALDIRYGTGSGDDKEGMDATIHGPILGVGIRF